MKHVIISADGERKVYSVPDVVADNLAKYCMDNVFGVIQVSENLIGMIKHEIFIGIVYDLEFGFFLVRVDHG